MKTVERTTIHVQDDTGRIAMLESRTYGTASDDNNTAAELVRYIYSNHLQNASLELDENAEIISYEEYHPYGTSAYQAKSATIDAVAKRYRYTGKERDDESGLYYHGARYYVPWLCRWTASDPLESKYAGMSPYNYSFNNPVMFNDPSGAEGEDVINEGTRRQKEYVREYESPDPGVMIPIMDYEVSYYHRGSEGYAKGWYSENEYVKINDEVITGFAHASGALLGRDKDYVWGGKAAADRADKAALQFIEANRGHISSDFLRLLNQEVPRAARDFKRAHGGFQSGVVYLTDSPVDYFAGGIIKAGLKLGVKGAGAFASSVEGGVASMNAFSNAAFRNFAVETTEAALKNLPRTELGKSILATEESVNIKLSKYLLDLNHPVGGAKAKWFKQALGFTQENAGLLAKQIVFDHEKAVQTAVTEFGTKYNQTIPIHGANGKTIDVLFSWIRNNDNIVRLVTAIPSKK